MRWVASPPPGLPPGPRPPPGHGKQTHRQDAVLRTVHFIGSIQSCQKAGRQASAWHPARVERWHAAHCCALLSQSSAQHVPKAGLSLQRRPVLPAWMGSLPCHCPSRRLGLPRHRGLAWTLGAAAPTRETEAATNQAPHPQPLGLCRPTLSQAQSRQHGVTAASDRPWCSEPAAGMGWAVEAGVSLSGPSISRCFWLFCV